MASAGSCRIGFSPSPSNGAGLSRVNGFDVTMMKRRNRRDRALHREHIGLEAARRIGAVGRDTRAEQREDQHPQNHRAFVVPPHARDLVEQGLAECEFCQTFFTEKSEVT